LFVELFEELLRREVWEAVVVIWLWEISMESVGLRGGLETWGTKLQCREAEVFDNEPSWGR
jgi:hypothetical protein